jgi:hypothetical protein
MSDFTPPKPTKEHEWLQQLVGEWTWESDTSPEPGKPEEKHRGSESVRSLDGIWVIADGKSEMPDGATSATVMTLGYDPRIERYVGTFVAAMMTEMWVYEGTLDASKNELVLDTEGPSFSDTNKRAKYKDTIRVEDADHRVLSSVYQDENGKWNQFMLSRYTRKPGR